MYVRGSRQDYDDWAELAEDEGWSADVMLQYMRKHQVRLMQTTILIKVLTSSNIDAGASRPGHQGSIDDALRGQVPWHERTCPDRLQ